MTFLILFLAFIFGIFTGLFLFPSLLKMIHKDHHAGTVGRFVLWLAVVIILAIVILMIYPYAELGLLVGLLFSLGCCLYHPSEESSEENNKENE